MSQWSLKGILASRRAICNQRVWGTTILAFCGAAQARSKMQARCRGLAQARRSDSDACLRCPVPLPPARARLESRVGGGGEGGALSVWPEPFGVYQSRSIQLHVRGAAASPRRTPEPWGHGSSHRRTVRGLCVLSSGFPSPRRVCSSTRLKSTGRQLRARWSAHPVERWKQDTPSPLREPVFARLARLCSGHLPGRRDASW